jgi:parvulin-like peptidyl-prolyl isomerase
VSESGTKDKGGLLGTVGRGDLSQALEAVAFSMPAGQVSDALETPYGFHILKVETRQVSERASLDEVRENLREVLAANKYDEDVTRFRKKIRSEAEWCVKRKYRDRIAPDEEVQICES